MIQTVYEYKKRRKKKRKNNDGENNQLIAFIQLLIP